MATPLEEMTMIHKFLTTIAFCLSVGGCSLMVDKNTHSYPQASKDAFMASCTKNSRGQTDTCSCMLVKMQERYTYGQMAEMEEKIKSGQPAPEFTEFVKTAGEECSKVALSASPSSSEKH